MGCLGGGGTSLGSSAAEDRSTHIGIKLPHKAGEVVVLEVQGQQVARKFGRLPHDEAAGSGCEGAARVSGIAAGRGGAGAGAGRRHNMQAVMPGLQGCAASTRAAHLWPSAPHEIIGSEMASSTSSYLQQRGGKN